MHRLTTIVLALLWATPALAAGGGLDLMEVMWHAINLAILLVLLAKFAMPAIKDGMAARSAAVSADITEATGLHAEARALFEEYEAKLSGLEAEAQALMTRYREEGELEKERMIEAAKVEAERIRSEAERSAKSEISKARRRLEAEIVDLAIAAAQTAVAEKITPADHRRLTGEYLSRLEDTKG